MSWQHYSGNNSTKIYQIHMLYIHITPRKFRSQFPVKIMMIYFSKLDYVESLNGGHIIFLYFTYIWSKSAIFEQLFTWNGFNSLVKAHYVDYVNLVLQKEVSHIYMHLKRDSNYQKITAKFYCRIVQHFFLIISSSVNSLVLDG